MRIKVDGQYKAGVAWVKVGGVYKSGNQFVKSDGQYKPDQTKRFAYNFDGVDDAAELTERAINVNIDNTLEFYSPSSITAGFAIIAQNIGATSTVMEFYLGIGGSRALEIVLGGSTTAILTIAQGFKPSTRYGISIVGNVCRVFEGGLDGVLLNTANVTKGAVREPSAKTTINARRNAGALFGFSPGLQYDVKINGVIWPMSELNQPIQQSVPSGNNMALLNTTSDRWQEIIV